MSAKERLATEIGEIDENEAERVLLYVRDVIKRKTASWDDIEEDDPREDEIEAYKAYIATK